VSLKGIELVKVNYAIASELRADVAQQRFSGFFAGNAQADNVVAPGDVLQVFVWEAPPAMLFSSQALASSGQVGGGTGMVSLPRETIDNAGNIEVPFAGSIHAAGLTLEQIEALITTKLAGKANAPQVLVQLVTNNTQDITVVGNVAHSMEVPLNPGGIQLLRAIALAGGVTQPVEKTSIQLSRDGQIAVLPLETVLTNPAENITLAAGDVVTALYQPLSFTVLGATARNAEINFPASGISLAQAMAKVGGVDDNRSNPAGVFLFRFESPKALSWPVPPTTLVQGKVPTIFQFNLTDPATFFAAQTFPVENHDLIYVSNAPVTDLQKVLNVVGSVVYPFQTMQTMGVIK
jgi:polysaccharide export outer membrane protein